MIAPKKTAPREEAGICTTGSGGSDVWLGGAIERRIVGNRDCEGNDKALGQRARGV
jgi:hypothetical protein